MDWPAASSIVAVPWRRSWKRTGGSPALRTSALKCSEPQPPQRWAILAGERGIRAVIAQPGHFVEQRGRPQVRVLGQPGRAVRGEQPERISCGPGPAA